MASQATLELSELPTEIIFDILHSNVLSNADKFRASQVCKLWRCLLSDLNNENVPLSEVVVTFSLHNIKLAWVQQACQHYTPSELFEKCLRKKMQRSIASSGRWLTVKIQVRKKTREQQLFQRRYTLNHAIPEPSPLLSFIVKVILPCTFTWHLCVCVCVFVCLWELEMETRIGSSSFSFCFMI